MLLNFSVKNFRSFKDKQSLSFVLDSGDRIDKDLRFEIKNKSNKFRVLKNALIFGANASGKSNIIDGIYVLADLILSPITSSAEHFGIDTFGFNDEPTDFEVDLFINDKLYRYEISYSYTEVLREKLVCDDLIIFNRIKQDFNFLSLDGYLKEFLEKTVRKNSLLLFAAQSQNLQYSIEVFNWFSTLVNKDLSYYTDMLSTNAKYKKKVLYGLKFADFNIVDIEIEKVKTPIGAAKIERYNSSNEKISIVRTEKNSIVETYVYFKHETNDKSFKLNLRSESSGTQQYFYLLLKLLDVSNKDVQVIIEDEFDRAIHKTLSKSIIKLLNTVESNMQFVSTTHNSSLMDALNKHQIYFVDKIPTGESEIYSLGDFEDIKVTRKDAKFSPKYEEGLYGATQIVNESGLLSLMEESNEKT